MGKQIIWTRQAVKELSQAFDNLYEICKSVEIAKRVIAEIHQSTGILSNTPYVYKLDNLKDNNPGNIRAYEKHTHRISYLITKKAIYIIRVRYARKEPLEF